MKTSTIIWVLVGILIILGIFYFYSAQPATAPATPSGQTIQNTQGTTQGSGNANTSANTSAGNTASVPMSATVTLTSNGFSPATVTIASGGTVTWVDQSGNPMWVASNVHPTHTVYDGTSRDQHCASGYSGPASFDECGPGTSYSFTFGRMGAWGYHNHMSSSQTGTVIVQ